MPIPVRRRLGVCAFAACVALLSACQDGSNRAPVPVALSPITALAPPEPETKPKAPAFQLPPELVEALQGIEWEPLDYLDHLPTLAYKVTPDCELEYVELGALSFSDDAFGSIGQSFYQSFVLRETGGSRWVRSASSQVNHLKVASGTNRFDTFIGPSGESARPLSLGVASRSVTFPSFRSPIFHVAAAADRSKVSPMNAWPELPADGAPATWRYNLLFDKPETLESQPGAKVELIGWLRLGFQRVAYLTATWEQAPGRVAISPTLAHLKLQGRGPLRSSLEQNREIKGHYLISELGHLVLARVEGMARIRNSFRTRPRGQRTANREVVEDRLFSFTTKLISDCNGSLLSRAESEELTQAEIVALAESFWSLMALDRKAEAAALLSPSIRFGFPDGGIPWLLLSEHAKVVGSGFLANPSPSTSDEGGVDFVGKNKKTKRPIYSTIRGERVGDERFLTFIGSSTSPSRKRWDFLHVYPANVHSGAISFTRP